MYYKYALKKLDILHERNPKLNRRKGTLFVADPEAPFGHDQVSAFKNSEAFGRLPLTKQKLIENKR